MGKRSRMKRATKAALTTSEAEQAQIDEFLKGMRDMAQAFLDRTVERLRAGGASELDIVQLQNASRLLAISDVQCMDLGAMFDTITEEDLDNGEGLSNKIVEALMEGLIPEEG